MAVGDDAKAANYPLVPDTGNEDAKVKWGAREINRTRDFVAQVLAKIPVGKAGFRERSGILSGNTDPSNDLGEDGDIYFKVLP